MKVAAYMVIAGFAVVACSEPSENNTENMTEEHSNHHAHHHGEANAHMHKHDYNELVARFESKERDDYQQPEKVMEYLGDMKGMRIMDIGAGTGYFSFRMANKGASVIAADVDDKFQDYIKTKRDSLHLGEDQLTLRKIPYDSPALAEGEVDKVIIVNTYHHIGDRIKYFSEVKKGLKDGGELVVIDFFKKELPYGPPVDMKLSEEEVKKELSEAGFDTIEVNSDLLQYQYIIRAK